MFGSHGVNLTFRMERP